MVNGSDTIVATASNEHNLVTYLAPRNMGDIDNREVHRDPPHHGAAR